MKGWRSLIGRMSFSAEPSFSAHSLCPEICAAQFGHCETTAQRETLMTIALTEEAPRRLHSVFTAGPPCLSCASPSFERFAMPTSSSLLDCSQALGPTLTAGAALNPRGFAPEPWVI
jgi:hypothetical protein